MSAGYLNFCIKSTAVQLGFIYFKPAVSWIVKCFTRSFNQASQSDFLGAKRVFEKPSLETAPL